MNDEEFLKVMQSHGLGKHLILSTQHYEEFDASDGNTIVEFKHRGQDYAEYIVDSVKIGSNLNYAQKMNKNFFFAIITPKRLIVWDIVKYILSQPKGVLFIPQILPENQNPGNNRKLVNLVHYIPVMDAIKIIQLKK